MTEGRREWEDQLGFGALIPVGIIPVGIIPVGIIPVGIIPVEIIPVELIPVGKIPVGIIPVGIISVGIIPDSKKCDGGKGRRKVKERGPVRVWGIDIYCLYIKL